MRWFDAIDQVRGIKSPFCTCGLGSSVLVSWPSGTELSAESWRCGSSQTISFRAHRATRAEDSLSTNQDGQNHELPVNTFIRYF